jgi:hypothetical protein
MTEMTVLWHYTFLPHLESIVRDGLIRPATALVEPPERPIVWFSKNQFWERTVTKGMKFRDGRLIQLDFKAMKERRQFPVRIGVLPEAAPYDWLSLRRMSRMKPEKADGLHRAAEKVGADPRHWRGTFTPFSKPGKPTDNAFVESFNGTFRAECLDAYWFTTLTETRQIVETWRREYNESRPHRALGERTPNEFANEIEASRDFIEIQTAANSP